MIEKATRYSSTRSSPKPATTACRSCGLAASAFSRKAAAARMPNGRTRRCDPLLERARAPRMPGSIALPAEHRLSARHCRAGHEETRVGEKVRGLRQAREVHARDLVGNRGIRHARGELAQLRVLARQLV